MGGGDLTRDFVSRINQLQDGHKMSQEYNFTKGNHDKRQNICNSG